MEINVDIADKALFAELTDFERKQVPFALANTLNELSFDYVRSDLKHEIKDVFDRPTPYTLNSVQVKKATKAKPVASVLFKDWAGKAVPAAKYMIPSVEGGGRSLKRFEIALRSIGILPTGYFAMPGKGARVDAWGNMSRGQIVQILSYFRAFGESGFRANSTDKTRARMKKGRKVKGVHQRGFEYFAVRPGDLSERRRGLKPGIYEKTYTGFGAAIKPVLIFVTRARYEPIYDFEFVVDTSVNKYLPEVWSRNFDRALRTAR